MKDINFEYKNSLVEEEEINKTANTISDYVEYVLSVSKGVNDGDIQYSEPESSIKLPFDYSSQEIVKKIVDKHKVGLKYIVVIGIGGSNLGTKAVYEAIRGTFDTGKPKIIFADTTSPKLISQICNILGENIKSPDEVVLNVISKSGATTETIANFEVIYSFLNNHLGGDEKIKESVVVTTDKNSDLWSIAKGKGFDLLEIPKKVGGRYSVFSPVGLLPLSLVGLNVDMLVEGARDVHKSCADTDVFINPALMSASVLYIHNKKGVSINNVFFFNPHLESIGKWYRQLMGESIGKKYSINGDEINAGITPIISIGSTDLHSMAQLYLGGPKDKFTTFVYSSESRWKSIVPREMLFSGLVEGIEGKNISEIMSAIFNGVKEAYKKNNLPLSEIIIEEINEYTVGCLMQFKMFEMMYLAKLLGVNAFDQPSVEDYKKETRKNLQ